MQQLNHNVRRESFKNQQGFTVNMATINQHADFIWSIAELLRGDYKQSEYGRVVLPFTVLRRLDCVLDDVDGEGVEGDGA